MKPEDIVKAEIDQIFDCRNVMQMSRETGIPQPTLWSWKKYPSRIKAVDLYLLKSRFLPKGGK